MSELRAQFLPEGTRLAARGGSAAGRSAKTRKFPLAWERSETVEWVLFWAFVAGLAWVPFWYGSNDLIAWGINAVLFPGLAVIYEVSIVVRRKFHPVGVKELKVPAALFGAVLLWMVIQNATWTPLSWHHPIWQITADALARPIEGSISVNRDVTTLGLVTLITAASVFWIAVQLCRNASRASYFLTAIVTIISVYAAYGLISFASTSEPIVRIGNISSPGFVTSTFINHNHFATYAGIGFIAVCGLILRLYRREVATKGGSLQFRIASIIEITGQKGALLLGSAFLMLVAVLLTGSRGGIISTGLGLFILGVLTVRKRERGFTKHLATIVFGVLVFAVVFLAFGDIFFGKVTDRGPQGGLYDENRMAVYMMTLRSIFDAPLLGYGYGTFADVFPMFRDRSISVRGVWEHAHNTYLEIFQGLGLVFGSIFLASIVLLVLKCLRGATERTEGVTVARVATSIAFLAGIHALVDFSLEMQAVALTFMALLGAGVAQSKNPRLALDD